jgi:hypothetical protein
MVPNGNFSFYGLLLGVVYPRWKGCLDGVLVMISYVSFVGVVLKEEVICFFIAISVEDF